MDTNTPTLTEEEKKYLESYKEENPFLKSLSDFYKERAMLSEKQILALRKESESHKKKISHCPTTGLMLKELCKFCDKDYNEDKMVIVNSIREKAICISDEDNNVYAWMPSSAVHIEIDINVDTGDELSIITLKSWFTRDDDFWKQSKPFEPNNKEEVKEESVPNPPVEDNNLDEGLPF
jgi:hypothetical protein